MILSENNYFMVIRKEEDIFIKVKKGGFDIRNFNEILEQNLRITLTNFLGLKKALLDADNTEIKIGKMKPEIELMLSNDEMECKAKVNCSQEYISQNKKSIVTNIITKLKNKGIKEGIMSNVFHDEIPSCKDFLVAKGTLPTNGDDAQIKYFDLSQRKPQIRKDGTANYYELDLIHTVTKGDWLGQKKPPTEGRDGITVTGKKLPAKRGKDKPLRYDRKTIEEYNENGIIIIKSLTDGAVAYKNGKIFVEKHLVVDDVDYSVGNIKFDGFVTIKGTVKDGFSVVAKYDISILNDMGIGATGKIQSIDGSIFIKGGINGKFVTEIEAKKDVYVKYCNEATITAGRKIDIGYYSIDCNLKAKKIFMDKNIGKLIGGNISAESQIITATIGNKFEKKTILNVKGFDRISVKRELNEILKKYRGMLTCADELKADLDIYELNYSINNDESFLEEYKDNLKKYDKLIEEIMKLDDDRLKLEEMLKSRGEGQVSVLKAAYPKTFLELKRIRKKVDSLVKGTFYIKGRELLFEEE